MKWLDPFPGGQNMDYLEKANKSFADGFKQ